MFLGLIVAGLVVILDQVSKYAVLNYVLDENSAIAYTSFFNLVKAWNTGVSFSMFNDGGAWGIAGLSALAMVIVFYLLRWMSKENNKLIQVALGFIVGGAIGNVIDRVRLGAVFDFLDFHINGSHWPAFNAADSFICIGAVIIILHALFTGSKSAEEKKNNE